MATKAEKEAAAAAKAEARRLAEEAAKAAAGNAGENETNKTDLAGVVDGLTAELEMARSMLVEERTRFDAALAAAGELAKAELAKVLSERNDLRDALAKAQAEIARLRADGPPATRGAQESEPVKQFEVKLPLSHDGEDLPIGAPVWLSRKQFLPLQAAGVVDGEWPDDQEA